MVAKIIGGALAWTALIGMALLLLGHLSRYNETHHWYKGGD